MSKVATFFLLITCVAIAGYCLLNAKEAPDVRADSEGKTLKLLSELTDEELERAMSGQDISIPLVQPEPLEPSESSESSVQAGADIDIDQSPETLPEAESTPDQAQASAPEVAVVEEVEPACMLVGEYTTRAKLSSLKRSLNKIPDIEMTDVEREEEVFRDYFVYIEPVTSRQAAVQIVRDLRSDGVESFVINNPPFENGISLGVFKNDENSAEFVRRLRGLDYDVIRQKRNKTTTFYSVFLKAENETLVDEAFWQEIRRDFSDIQVTEKSCEEVASASNFQ